MFSILRTPAGRFAFVGSVPADLAFIHEAQQDLDTAAHSGPGVAMKIAAKEGRVFKPRSWATEAEAWAAALEWAGGDPAELAKHAVVPA